MVSSGRLKILEDTQLQCGFIRNLMGGLKRESVRRDGRNQTSVQFLLSAADRKDLIPYSFTITFWPKTNQFRQE